MTIIAKFKVDSVTLVPRYRDEALGDTEGSYPVSENLTLTAFIDEPGGNADWALYTPSGKIEMCIDNPKAQGAFPPGATVLVTLSVDA